MAAGLHALWFMTGADTGTMGAVLYFMIYRLTLMGLSQYQIWGNILFTFRTVACYLSACVCVYLSFFILRP